MKLHRYLGLLICSSFLLGGCKKNVRLVYDIPPTANTIIGQAETGSIVEWTATGVPFQIAFGAGGNPCLDDSLTSDGRSPVICHLKAGQIGDYTYDVRPLTNDQIRRTAGGPPTVGQFPLRVRSCVGCTLFSDPTPLPPAAVIIYLYCDPGNAKQPAIATPSPAQTAKDTNVYWSFYGTKPNHGDSFDVTIPKAVCSNHKDGATINSDSEYCTVAAGFTYRFTASGCSVAPGSGEITLPVAPIQ